MTSLRAARSDRCRGRPSGQAGHWEVNTGSGFTKLEGVSQSAAMLLNATDLIRFVPDANFSGSARLTFRAWDQTKGTAGAKASIASLGDSVCAGDLDGAGVGEHRTHPVAELTRLDVCGRSASTPSTVNGHPGEWS